MASHKSHFRHAKKYKENRAICTRDFSSVVAGGVICHSPVVIPRWGRVLKSFIEWFPFWFDIGSSSTDTGMNDKLWIAKLHNLMLMTTGGLPFSRWLHLIFEFYVWLGQSYPEHLKSMDSRGSTDDYLLMTIDERITRGTRLPNLTWKQPRRNLYKVYVEL